MNIKTQFKCNSLSLITDRVRQRQLKRLGMHYKGRDNSCRNSLLPKRYAILLLFAAVVILVLPTH